MGRVIESFTTVQWASAACWVPCREHHACCEHDYITASILSSLVFDTHVSKRVFPFLSVTQWNSRTFPSVVAAVTQKLSGTSLVLKKQHKTPCCFVITFFPKTSFLFLSAALFPRLGSRRHVAIKLCCWHDTLSQKGAKLWR